MTKPLQVLFVCSVNICRSKTAERLVNQHFGHLMFAKSAGTSDLAKVQVTRNMITNAQAIVVMEEHHKAKLLKRFGRDLRRKEVKVLDIPDDFAPDEPELKALLLERIPTAVGIELVAVPAPAPVVGSLW